MTRPFADLHLRRAQRPKRFERCGNHADIGIDAGLRIELDQIGLEQHPLAAHVETALLHAFEDTAHQILGIRFRFDHRDRRRFQRFATRRLGALKSRISGENAGARDSQKFAAVRTHVVPPVWKKSAFSSAMMLNAAIMVSGTTRFRRSMPARTAPCNRRAMVSHARASGERVSAAIRAARSSDFSKPGALVGRSARARSSPETPPGPLAAPYGCRNSILRRRSGRPSAPLLPCACDPRNLALGTFAAAAFSATIACTFGSTQDDCARLPRPADKVEIRSGAPNNPLRYSMRFHNASSTSLRAQQPLDAFLKRLARFPARLRERHAQRCAPARNLHVGARGASRHLFSCQDFSNLHARSAAGLPRAPSAA